MALDDTERDRTRRYIMRLEREKIGLFAVSKADLLAAVGAFDDWLDDHGAELNAVLPQPFRSQATLDQKAITLGAVAARRGGYAQVEEDG